MRSTVLFSAVEEVAARHPLFVSELQEFFRQHTLPVGTPEVVTLLADRLDHDSLLAEDLVSMLRVVCADEPAISYLDLLGLLLAASGVASANPDLREAAEPDARRLFNFVVEHRRAMKSELATTPVPAGSDPDHFNVAEFSFTEVAAETGAHPHESLDAPVTAEPDITTSHFDLSALRFDPNPPAVVTRTDQANVALARALAISADGDAFPPRPVPLATLPAPEIAASEIATPVLAAQPHLSMPQQKSSWLRSAVFGLCGILLGLALGLLWQRRNELTPTPTATMASGEATSPVLPVVAPGAVVRQGRVPITVPPRPAVPVAHNRSFASASTPGRPGSYTAGTMPAAPAANRPAPISPSRSSVFAPSAVLGSAPISGPRPGTVREVRLDAPAELASAQARNGLRPRVLVGSAGIMAANLVSSPAPVYPVQASAARVQGEVVVEAVVGRDGSVIDTRVVSGPPLLRQAALSAVQRWRYRPYQVDGETSEIATTARLSFQLDTP